MIFSRIIALTLTVAAWTVCAAESPGLTAYREQNYGSAVRLLRNELAQSDRTDREFFEKAFSYIDSLLYNGNIVEAQTFFNRYQGKVPADCKASFELLRAKLAYVGKDFDNCSKILETLKNADGLTGLDRFDIAVLQSEVLLFQDKGNEAVDLLELALKDADIVKNGEFTLRLQLMRALAATGKLNRIPSEYDALKQKYPEMQGRLRHFELLIFAINQDLKSYRQLFAQIFPDGRPSAALIGDPVLYQGALLGEQQAQKEKNAEEIVFHLKNQTWFAPNDEYRAASYFNLIELYLNKNDKKSALAAVRGMLKNIKNLPDAAKWQMICASLQNELGDGDSGLEIYLKIKNNAYLEGAVRAEAAENAAQIYKKLGKNTEMLKLYAFMADFPDNRKINDRGVLLTGKYYFERGEYRMGESVLSRIQPDSLNYNEALFYLIQCRIANGEYQSAAADVQKLAELKNDENNTGLPDTAFAALYFNAVIAEALKKEDEAAELYEKAARSGAVSPAALPMIANSWLKAAELQFKRHSYSSAGLLFLTFAEQYPKHKDTAAALYKSVYSYFLADRRDEMKYSMSKLQKDFPRHELTINAFFHETDYLKGNDLLQEALKTLDTVFELNNNRNAAVSAQVYYDKALLFYQLRRDSAALDELKKLEALPQNPLLAEGMFLAGTIASEQGRNLDAAGYFSQASSMRDELLFKSSSAGRAADNYFLAGTKNKESAHLKKALDIYANLVKNQKLSTVFRVQCFYKLGRTYEAMQDYQNALDAYTEALYLNYGDNEIKNSTVIPVWVNRSALNAIDIHLRQGGSNALNDAIFIIRRLKKLNTMTAKELENLEYNVRNRYVRND